MNNLKKKVPEILLAISSQFRLDEINSQNWEEYRAGLYGLSSDSVFAHDTNQQRATLAAFFDIFENRQKNDEIIKYTNRMSNHTEFSSVIDKGDFIASDKANDGNWDHMGFVTNKDNTYRYYSNGDYYNYEVAQHTEGYIKWADKNGWPMTGGALGRARR